jgi:c-di-GMP-binding flagellar brake protein YcgR
MHFGTKFKLQPKQMDRRTKSRIDVQLTCYVGAGRVTGEPMRALTENVSRTGILMRWMEGVPLPKVDGKLVLDLKLPENSDVGPRVMRCRTEVRRVAPGAGNSHEVALRVLSMRFVKGKREFSASDLASMPVAADRVS